MSGNMTNKARRLTAKAPAIFLSAGLLVACVLNGFAAGETVYESPSGVERWTSRARVSTKVYGRAVDNVFSDLLATFESRARSIVYSPALPTFYSTKSSFYLIIR